MNKKKLNTISEISSSRSDYAEMFGQSRPKHLHRRTISKTSDELLASLKIPSPPVGNRAQIITPQILIDHITKKGLHILKEEKLEESMDYFSDDELHIRNIIEQRKVLSPISVPEFKTKKTKANLAAANKRSSQLKVKNTSTTSCLITGQEPERISFNTSTTALTITEESNIDRIILLLENEFLGGNSNRNVRSHIIDLMQKSPEPRYTLVLDHNYNLQGVYYIEIATGYFHRILGNDIIPMVIAPRKVKSFLHYEKDKGTFQPSSPPKFDAVILK